MSGSGFAQFIPLILIFVIFYFFLIRPQQKKVKEHKLMVAALKRGDEVVTSGGIVGKVERILGDDKVDISISENVTVQVVQSTIQSLLKSLIQKNNYILCYIFRRLKLVTIYFIIVFLSLFSFANFLEIKNDFFFIKKS